MREPALWPRPAARRRRADLSTLQGYIPEETRAHGIRVAELAVAAAARLPLGERELDDLVWAARLHDIGKVVVPLPVLEKAGPLDELEWRMVRWHTLVGERMILRAVPTATVVGALVRWSHERHDGFGYPDGLTGRAIPLGARILHACDAFDAMVSERSYQNRRGARDALTELRRCAGGQFDPEVVDALCAAVEDA
jgi:two-component system, cell cycle response regulator